MKPNYTLMRHQDKKILVKLIKHIIGPHYWKKRNIIFIILGFFFSYALLSSQFIHDAILFAGDLGYIGAFFVGMLYTYVFTAIPAAIGLFLLSENLNPLLVAAIGASGAIISDFIIYTFVKNNLVKEVELAPEIKSLVRKLKQSKFWRRFIPLIAYFIIASPLPDELGVALLGVVKFQPKKFLMHAYIFNFIGILLIATASRIL